jgi:predicted kinase
LTHGFSGSGKTTVAATLVPRLPGIRVRSDIERKRMAGLSPRAASASPVAGGLYGPDMGQRTYAHLLECARLAIEAGISIVVDAAFLMREQRAPFRALAEALRAHFVILDCRAPEAVLRARIDARRAKGTDASEATESVLDYQLRTHEPLDGVELGTVVAVDCSAPIDPDAVYAEIVRAARAAGSV